MGGCPVSGQPILEGLDVPAPVPARRVADDYETWIAEVWPAFERAATSGQEFTAYEIARREQLPEPPDPAHHWGRLMTRLQEEDVIRRCGWAQSGRPTTHASGVRTWIGVSKRLGAA